MTYRTGADAERLAELRLVRLGYLVHRARHRGEQADGARIPYGQDLIAVPDERGRLRGLFDLVALGPDGTRWVQVKAVRGMASPPGWWRRAVEGLPTPPGTSYELWLLREPDPRWRDECWRAWKRTARGWSEGEEGPGTWSVWRVWHPAGKAEDAAC